MKINLCVLFGGRSVEHEISVISALQAMENLNENNKISLYVSYTDLASGESETRLINKNK